MKNKIVLGLLAGMFLVGCGQPEITDPCEIDYQACEAKCKITTATKSELEKTACEAKCKTLFVACKAKQKAKESYEYIKEKVKTQDKE